MNDKSVAAAIGYMERVGFQNVTLVDEGGNVVLGTLDEGGKHLMVAVIVDEHEGLSEPWDEAMYCENFGELAEGGMKFDRGDLIIIHPIAPDRALLRHQSGIWPGGE